MYKFSRKSDNTKNANHKKIDKNNFLLEFLEFVSKMFSFSCKPIDEL